MSRVAFVLVLAVLLSACGGRGSVARTVPGGDPDRGRDLVVRYGCGGCHMIGGIKGADGRIGPSLEDLAGRRFIAGSLPNTPEQVVRWIQDPPKFRPDTLMPVLGVTADEARDIVAYLYSQ